MGDVVEATSLLRARLHWTEGESRWAVMDVHGRVMAEGRGPVSPSNLSRELILKGIPTESAHAEAFLRDHLDRVLVRARIAALKYFRARAYMERRHLEQQGRKASESLSGADEATRHKQESDAWSDYLASALEVLVDPLGTSPEIFRLHQPTGMEPEGLHEGDPFQAFAYRALPAVEDQLLRRPGDESLWKLWCVLLTYSRRSPEELLPSLRPSPMTPSNSWPPIGALRWMASNFAEAGRWGSVIALLEPRWQEHLARAADPAGRKAREGGQGGAWDPWLARPLMEALLRSGRSEDAARVLLSQPRGERSRYQDLASLDPAFGRVVGEAP